MGLHQLHLLHLIGEYIRSGPQMLKVTSGEGEIMLPGTTLSQDEIGRGPSETVSLFLPSPQFWPAESNPVVRRVTWDYRPDNQETIAGKTQTWPSIDVTFYSISFSEVEELDTKVRAVEVALSQLQFEESGLKLRRFYERDDQMPHASQTTPNRTHDVPRLRRRIFLSSGIDIQLTFTEQDDQSLNESWFALWQSVMSKCSEHRIIRPEELYDVKPEAYAAILK